MHTPRAMIDAAIARPRRAVPIPISERAGVPLEFPDGHV